MWQLKLCEKRACGSKMLVAALWQGNYADNKNYEEWMKCACNLPEIVFQSRTIDYNCSEEQRSSEYRKPLNPRELEKFIELNNFYLKYHEKSLIINEKEYDIYNANPDFLPCGEAPIIELTDEEVENWKIEFKNNDWIKYNDEMFLK